MPGNQFAVLIDDVITGEEFGLGGVEKTDVQLA